MAWSVRWVFESVQESVGEPSGAHRPIRSFVRRQGRMTPAQKAALEQLWPIYGLDGSGGCLDLGSIFEAPNPVSLEIGFGNGEALISRAASFRKTNYLGVEVHLPGVGRALSQAQERELKNLRLVADDAVDFLKQRIADASLSEILIEFPDPWPKKRHHKRRLIQTDFVRLLASKLKTGGALRLATDWAPYAEHMLEVLRAEPLLSNTSSTVDYVPRPQSRPLTRFERRGEKLGHAVFDLEFRRL